MGGKKRAENRAPGAKATVTAPRRAHGTLSPQYDPSEVETKWLAFWREQGFANADAAGAGDSYALTLPPPNVTGSLHMGHALGNTIQDILARWRRMQGRNVMWMPGTDHAGIATQMLVERDLRRREDQSRHDLGREGFLERVWQWKDKYGGRICLQLDRMGNTLDWPRQRFTMDEASSRAVREAFVRLYRDGLIYRAHRLVNWCSDCYTAISDLEVNNIDEKGYLWELEYPVVDSDRRIVVATTRPETMLGDTGVAVHPDDDRYRDLVGKTVKLPLTAREIPIVADSFVDPEFGSGAVKVTPAHDFNDFDCGARCGLESLSIISREGKIIEPAPAKYVGLTVNEARAAVVADLDAQGFLRATQDYTVPRGRCDRSNTVVEPLLSDQWFARADVLAKPAIAAVDNGDIEFVPELWTKTYMHWMTNIKDWCISRQLWWGHRIPAWYCGACEAVIVAAVDPTTCESCGGSELRQDDDVLDTWFSSALWPFSTLGWPSDDPQVQRDLATFYPNEVLVTAADIIFFWVARMIMMGLHFQGEVPFRKVYFTPIVTDDKGEKMSKVKGNVIDPLDVAEGATLEMLLERAENQGLKPGAVKNLKKTFPDGIPRVGSDALRFTLAAMALPGRNLRMSMERVEGYRNFVNKLWNASRFVLMNLEDFDRGRLANGHANRELPDLWILSRLQVATLEVGRALEQFRFAEAASVLYHFVWDEFCSWYIELVKNRLGGQHGDESRAAAQTTLAIVLERALRLMHPFMPFVTEEIWHRIPRADDAAPSLMVADYPVGVPEAVDASAEADMDLIQSVIVAVRSIRATYGVPPGQRLRGFIRTENADKRALLTQHCDLLASIARGDIEISPAGEDIAQAAKSVVGSDVDVVVPLVGLIDIDAERARISKQIGKTEQEIAFVSKKLSNEKFIARAPADVVEKERKKLTSEQERRSRLQQALEALT